MGHAYEGSIAQFIDQNDGLNKTPDELFVLAQQQGKTWTYDKIRMARAARRGVPLGPNGQPVRGTVTNALKARDPVAPDKRSQPGYFSAAKAGAKRQPPLAVAAGVVDIPVPIRKDDPAPYGRTLDGKPRNKPGPKPKAKAPPPTKAARAKLRADAIDEVYAPKTKSSAGAIVAPKVKPVAARAKPEPVNAQLTLIDDEPPPIKHTQLRKLILDVGLDVARDIIAEFHEVSERIR